MDSSRLETATQHIKDFKLAIEFKYLMKNAPAGVYLMPEFDNIRKLHGVIFIRRGLYRDGVFRFVMNLPITYNDENTHPEIIFTPPVFNPLIDPVTGKLDLRIDEFLKEWQPERHFIVTAITFLKRIFYMKSYDAFPVVPHEEARLMFTNDKSEYLSHISSAVESSLKRMYDSPNSTDSGDGENESSDCTLIFTEPKPAHEEVIQKVLSQAAIAEKERTELRRASTNVDDADSDPDGCNETTLEKDMFLSDKPSGHVFSNQDETEL